jgi:hypothetical protein
MPEYKKSYCNMSEDYSLRTRIQEIVDLINDVREEYGMALDFAFVVSLLERNEDGDVEMTRMGATSYDIEELYEEAEEHVRMLVKKNHEENYPDKTFPVDNDLKYFFANHNFPPHPLN